MFNTNCVQKSLTIIVFCLLIILLISPVVIANPSDVLMLKKVYKLDATISSGQCPSDLKRVLQATNEDFGCDRVRIDYGYRSNELVQCKLRKDLANKIIHEYNAFIEQCKMQKNNIN